MSGQPPPPYQPTNQFYSESQAPPPQQYNQFQGPISSQPGGYPPPPQPYVPQAYPQPQPQQTIIITDPNHCHDCRHGRCRRHGELTDEECCCLALAGACCLACLASNN